MPYDSGNECWKMGLIGLDGQSRGFLKLAQKGHDQDGEETWETYGKHRWRGKPKPHHFETLYQWELSHGGVMYFILIKFDHEFTEDDYAREVMPERAIEWLHREGYKLPDDLKAPGAGSDADDGAGAVEPAPLPDAQREVWNILQNSALSAKEIATQLLGAPSHETAIRKRIAAIRRTGRKIETRRGLGYFRPDAPPPDSSGAQRESR